MVDGIPSDSTQVGYLRELTPEELTALREFKSKISSATIREAIKKLGEGDKQNTHANQDGQKLNIGSVKDWFDRLEPPATDGKKIEPVKMPKNDTAATFEGKEIKPAQMPGDVSSATFEGKDIKPIKMPPMWGLNSTD